MHLDAWQASVDKRIVESVTVVGERASIEDNAVCVLRLRLQEINKSALVIRLEGFSGGGPVYRLGKLQVLQFPPAFSSRSLKRRAFRGDLDLVRGLIE